MNQNQPDQAETFVQRLAETFDQQYKESKRRAQQRPWGRPARLPRNPISGSDEPVIISL